MNSDVNVQPGGPESKLSAGQSGGKTIETAVATIRFSAGGGDSTDSDSDVDEYLVNSGLPGYHPKNYQPSNQLGDSKGISDTGKTDSSQITTPSSCSAAGPSQIEVGNQNTQHGASSSNSEIEAHYSVLNETISNQSMQDSNANQAGLDSVLTENLPNQDCSDVMPRDTENSDVNNSSEMVSEMAVNQENLEITGVHEHDQLGQDFEKLPIDENVSIPEVVNSETGNESPSLSGGSVSGTGDSSDKYGTPSGRSMNRFNPFDKLSEKELQEGSVFGSCSPTDSAEFRTCTGGSNSSSDSWSDIMPHFSSKSSKDGTAISNAELGLAEDHFGRPEGHFGLSTIEELEMAIQNCKVLIFEAPEHSERRKNLVNKLVQLRMRLLEAKEGPEVLEEDAKLVVGHRFRKKLSSSSKHYCEQCIAVIWGVIQNWYRCTECGYTCHEKCLNSITRTCASVKVAENPTYILSICPEKGLAAQNYRCLECRACISYKSGYGEPRQCDYTGGYYCERCHWNDTMIVPARVLHNYDLEPRKVCRGAKQYLRLMWHRPVLRIQDVNPMLFNFVEELNDIKKLREELLIMKKYFLSCQAALESKLLLQLQERQHFVENSDMYSLQDLSDVAADTLLPELAKIHSSFAQHIKTDCQLCQAKGYICELCDQQEVLFPFDNIAIVCSQCSTVLHRHCFIRRNQKCPKCDRRQRNNTDETNDKPT